jgi:flagellar motor switch protein FliN
MSTEQSTERSVGQSADTIIDRLPAAMADAAGAAARCLPASEAVTPGEVAVMAPTAPGVLPPGEGLAVVARLVGDGEGVAALVLGPSLVSAATEGMLGGSDVATGAGPALEEAVRALAASLGCSLAVEAAQAVPAEVALTEARTTTALVVPFADSSGHVATLVVAFDDDQPGSTAAAAADPTDTAESAAPLPPLDEFTRRGMRGTGRPAQSLDLLHDVEMAVSVELGRTRMPVRDLLALAPGAVVQLDRAAGSPVDLLVNGTLIARGEVVVIDEEFGIRISEIVGPDTAKRARS